MTHPTKVDEDWQALKAATHTDTLTDATRQLAAALEGDGYQVTILDGFIHVDAALPADPDTGIGDHDASWRIEQVG